MLDRLLYGHTDAAHLIAPLAIATTLGRGRPAVPLAAPFVLGLNGNAMTLSPATGRAAGRERRSATPPARRGARRGRARRKGGGRRLRFGVVHRYSSHNYMLRYWLAGLGHPARRGCRDRRRRAAVRGRRAGAGEIDGICVGEPWNSVAVDRGVGVIVLATAQIWRRGVEKCSPSAQPMLETAPRRGRQR